MCVLLLFIVNSQTEKWKYLIGPYDVDVVLVGVIAMINELDQNYSMSFLLKLSVFKRQTSCLSFMIRTHGVFKSCSRIFLPIRFPLGRARSSEKKLSRIFTRLARLWLHCYHPLCRFSKTHSWIFSSEPHVRTVLFRSVPTILISHVFATANVLLERRS